MSEDVGGRYDVGRGDRVPVLVLDDEPRDVERRHEDRTGEARASGDVDLEVEAQRLVRMELEVVGERDKLLRIVVDGVVTQFERTHDHRSGHPIGELEIGQVRAVGADEPVPIGARGSNDILDLITGDAVAVVVAEEVDREVLDRDLPRAPHAEGQDDLVVPADVDRTVARAGEPERDLRVQLDGHRALGQALVEAIDVALGRAETVKDTDHLSLEGIEATVVRGERGVHASAETHRPFGHLASPSRVGDVAGERRRERKTLQGAAHCGISSCVMQPNRLPQEYLFVNLKSRLLSV